MSRTKSSTGYTLSPANYAGRKDLNHPVPNTSHITEYDYRNIYAKLSMPLFVFVSLYGIIGYLSKPFEGPKRIRSSSVQYPTRYRVLPERHCTTRTYAVDLCAISNPPEFHSTRSPVFAVSVGLPSRLHLFADCPCEETVFLIVRRYYLARSSQ